MAAMLPRPTLRAALLDRLEPWLAANRAGGAFFDFEELPPASAGRLPRVPARGERALRQAGWVMAIAAPVGDADRGTCRPMPRIVDRVFLMAYDEHEIRRRRPGRSPRRHGSRRSVADAARGMPASQARRRDRQLRIRLARTAPATRSTVEEAWQAAREFERDADVRQGERQYRLRVSGRRRSRHVVWLLDAASAYNQIAFLQRAGIGSVALWRLGAEDPGVWSIFGRDHRKLPRRVGDRDRFPPGTDVDIEGQGEILKIAGDAGRRARDVGRRAADGTIADVAFHTIARARMSFSATGYHPKRDRADLRRRARPATGRRRSSTS